MACRMTEIVLDARDPDRLAAFWCEVLGWQVTDRTDEFRLLHPVEALEA